jgi:hypothetical protein
MMNKNRLMMMVALALLLLAGATSVFAGDVQADLAALRAATARFHRPEVAMAEGWGILPILDHCVELPGVGGEGYHLTKLANIDTTLDLRDPEALVYAPGPDGQWQFAAVAYVVNAAQWDAEGHTEPPSLLGQRFHYFPLTKNYVLHAWVWRHNPLGMFDDWNPNVTCP